jgi:hypothetical protein
MVAVAASSPDGEERGTRVELGVLAAWSEEGRRRLYKVSSTWRMKWPVWLVARSHWLVASLVDGDTP